jgi:NTE family protein
VSDAELDDPRATAPVADASPDPDGLRDGIALCLSGGGYRAMLFHVGALWRLNELGYLPRLDRVSSVSGGSITAATLGLRWGVLAFDTADVASPASFDAAVVTPLRGLARQTVDKGSVIGGLLRPRRSIADEVVRAYRKHLFGDATLQQLVDRPRFIINATNLQTGALWRFSKPYMADYTIGKIDAPDVALAIAVAASSAFPPFLSPLRLTVDPGAWAPMWRGENFRAPFTSGAALSDGGVYDNLGLEAAWKSYRTILVSDGGGKMQAADTVPWDWARQSYRVNEVIDNQVRNLRKRQTIAGFQRGDRTGTYWGIRSDAKAFGPPPGSLPTPVEQTRLLAETKTRLAAMDELLQERLINWGYAACDVAVRRWVAPGADAPSGFPYPGARVG